jgi:hypothetical protein
VKWNSREIGCLTFRPGSDSALKCPPHFPSCRCSETQVGGPGPGPWPYRTHSALRPNLSQEHRWALPPKNCLVSEARRRVAKVDLRVSAHNFTPLLVISSSCSREGLKVICASNLTTQVIKMHSACTGNICVTFGEPQRHSLHWDLSATTPSVSLASTRQNGLSAIWGPSLLGKSNFDECH